MKKKLFYVLAMMGMMSFASLEVSAAKVGFSVGYIDPANDQGESHRGPVTPSVDIEDYTLTFSTPCYGWTLELIDENDVVTYTTIITSDTLVLPSTLSGTYQLRLIPNDGNIYFYGYVVF